jgi:hypothetical protein
MRRYGGGMATNIDIDRLDLSDDQRLRLVAIMVELQEAVVESHNGGEDWPYVLAEVSFEDLLWRCRFPGAGRGPAVSSGASDVVGFDD